MQREFVKGNMRHIGENLQIFNEPLNSTDMDQQ